VDAKVAKAVVLVTFGCPRVGDHKFAATLERELINVHRVVHQDDLVTTQISAAFSSDDHKSITRSIALDL